jgi:hypothetical protein
VRSSERRQRSDRLASVHQVEASLIGSSGISITSGFRASYITAARIHFCSLPRRPVEACAEEQEDIISKGRE